VITKGGRERETVLDVCGLGRVILQRHRSCWIAVTIVPHLSLRGAALPPGLRALVPNDPETCACIRMRIFDGILSPPANVLSMRSAHGKTPVPR